MQKKVVVWCGVVRVPGYRSELPPLVGEVNASFSG
jgi:hypothetical protein